MKTKITLIAALVVTLMACSKSDGGGSSSYPKKATIEYKLTVASGTPTYVDISCTNENGGTDNLKELSLPFSKKITRTVNAEDYVSAIFSGSGPGGVKAELYIDGKLVDTKTASSNTSSSFNEQVFYLWK